jgi:hypothetical protein
MTGSGDEEAAATVGRSHLRASRADRREAADVLNAAFVQGWLYLPLLFPAGAHTASQAFPRSV